MTEERLHANPEEQAAGGVQAASPNATDAAQDQPSPGDRHHDGPTAGERAPGAPKAWRKRVVAHAEIPPGVLLAHPDNWKAHPDAQKAAIVGAIEEIGFIGEVHVSQRSGRILDGHMRVAEAVRAGQATIPVGYVDCVDDAEELRILATYDPIGSLAIQDASKLASLAARSALKSDSLVQMLGRLPRRPAIPDDDEPGGRVVGAAFGPQGGPMKGGPMKGGHLGQLSDVIYPIVVECATEGEQLELLNSFAEDGLAVYTLSPSPSAIGNGS